ncbi:ABC transporter substrate-binding protein [Roseovarius indicus]|jgi:spermidine/putrescine transport system substrate-binding protein|uniref:ABC transporter n=1 Tax=Roseovarius indicus TaxID=540747 RepID=A0A0T5P638_9RHOB|nr:extracellular solute-binding protein [Roseovarius indicus]KRS16415.1 ABC transporter [Roseovarius indicus]QEW28408.1 Putrescine-binding periplasmic protein precursor [Roseovarius indicus]SFE11280.1 spermidine/putrescine transport system substrate-binding protein [Roseovarius indicus]
MDVLDQLGSMREGKMSRRAFTKSLLAAGVAVTAVPMGGRRAMAAPEDQATYFTWGGYDIPELFGEYQEKHGELPNFSIFGGSEEALTKMRGGFVVDVSHPCNQALPRWVASDLFQPVETSKLEHWGDVMPALVDLPGNDAENGNVWMVPFDWGQTSITYRADLVDVEEESWDMLWNEEYKGKLGSLAAGADAWWVGAIKAGIPFEELDTPEAFEKIAAVMREQRPLIRTYTDDTTTLEQALASGELVAAMTWNSSAALLKSEGVDVKFADPKEGALTWVCGLMMHKDAPKPDRAYDVIDSLLSVETGKFMIGDYGYGHSNIKSFDSFSEEELSELGLSKTPADILQAGHFQIPQSQEWETKMNAMFEEIKAGF